MGLQVEEPQRKSKMDSCSLPVFSCSVWKAEEQPRKDVPVLTPGTGEYVVLHGERDFGDAAKGPKTGRRSPLSRVLV